MTRGANAFGSVLSHSSFILWRRASAMPIRTYQPGDEHAQARIYNTAAGSLPGFKRATAEEISRRYPGGDPDPESRYYAIETSRQPLLETVLLEMRKRGIPEAWTAYRANWSSVHDFLGQHDFTEKRQMINYMAEAAQLPDEDHLAANRVVEPLIRADLPELIAVANGLLAGTDAEALERFFWDNPFYHFSESLFVLKQEDSGEILGVSLLVVNDQFADPTKVDAAMPCFRLGAFGSERERHKRVNGLYSCVFINETESDRLLSATLRLQASRSVPTVIAAQAPSDAPALCAWYDRFFQRQGSFPIWSRRL
jgi:hypothetical protein